VYGANVQLIVPTEAFVVKTRGTVAAAAAASSGAGMADVPVYINMCSSDKLEPMKVRVGQGAFLLHEFL
jgi:hypothetical protein